MNDIPMNPEMQQLQSTIDELRRDREQDQQTIKSLRQELDQLRRWLLSSYKSSLSEEQLRHWTTEENVPGVELEAFMGELETLVHEHSPKR